MIRKERLEQIYRMITNESAMSSHDLAKHFGVSDVTIRKDLNLLAQQGRIERTFGGAATPVLPSAESSTDHTQTMAFPPLVIQEDRMRLAQETLRYVERNDNIFLGSGLTCCALASLLPSDYNLSVVTNNLSALPLLVSKNIKVFLVGGEVASLEQGTYFSSISNPAQYLESVRVNKAFTSCYGLDIHAGVTVNSVVSSYVFKVLPQIVQQWTMMLTPEKFSTVGMYQVCTVDALHRIICVNPPDSLRTYATQRELNLVEVSK